MRKKMLIERVPLDLVVIIFCLLLAVVHANKQTYTRQFDGILSVLVSLAFGYLNAWAMAAMHRHPNWFIVLASATVSYLSTGILIAISKMGAQVLAKPNALLRAALPGFLSKLIPDDEPDHKGPDDNPLNSTDHVS